VYRYILLLVLALSTTSCRGVSKIKERHHRAPFEKEIKKGDYELTFYSINYPIKYEEKIKFYNDFYILLEKLLVSDSAINIICSKELKDDITQLELSYILPEELVFLKSASELSKADRDSIDEKVKVKLKGEIGRTQYYLNKQIYFLEKIIGSNKLFNSEINYTELDKERLVLKVKEKRKKIFKILKQGELNLILGIEQPYLDREKKYWEKKDVYIDRSTNLLPELLKENRDLYLSGVEDIDTKKIIAGQLKFNSKIIVVENSLYNGYIISDDKYIFFYGGENEMNYYDGYNLKIKVQNISLKDLLVIDENYLKNNFLNPKFYKERQGK